MSHTCKHCPGVALVDAPRLARQRSPRMVCPKCGARFRVTGSAQHAPSTAFSRNDAGRMPGERSDCSVRAYALAYGVTYAEAHAVFTRAGREARKGTPYLVSVAVMGAPCEFFPRSQRPTFAAWVRTRPAGRWVVHIAGHAFAVVDGVWLDAGSYKPRARVVRAWRIRTGGL